MTITLKPGEELYIPTVHGLIQIRRGDTDARKIMAILPEGLTGVKGLKDVKLPLLDYIKGKITPKFHLLVPRIIEGLFSGVEIPKVLKVG